MRLTQDGLSNIEVAGIATIVPPFGEHKRAGGQVEGRKVVGRLKLADKHLASVNNCIDDEIIGWLERRERRKRDRLAGSRQSVYRYLS